MQTTTLLEVEAWEDEGGSLYPELPRGAIRQLPRRAFGLHLGAALERGWSHLWVYNETRWSVLRAVRVGAILLLTPLLVATVAVPVAFLVAPAVVLASPVIVTYFILRGLGGVG